VRLAEMFLLLEVVQRADLSVTPVAHHGMRGLAFR